MAISPSFRDSRLATATKPIVLNDGTTLDVTIRRSARASRIALRLHPGRFGVELVVPGNVSLQRAQAFLESRLDWIAERVRCMPPRIQFLDGTIVPVLGADRQLTHIAGRDRSRAPFTLTDKAIEVTGLPDHVPRRTVAGLKDLANRLLAEKTAVLAQELSRPLGKVSIGDAQTRWGSCTRTGNIKYSWRLILAPEPVLDYVVAHEVAHLAEMNHSDRFWRIVTRLRPSFQDERAWLREHAAQLHRYG